MLKDSKYLFAYLAPLSVFIALHFGGIWSFTTVVLTFVLIPIGEFFTSNSEKNLRPEEESKKVNSRFFDLLLYLNVPILFGLLWLYFSRLQNGGLATFELVGMTFSAGIIIGTIGINVAHELGHRLRWYERLMSKILLMTALYMHFFIEHNRGHHKQVATEKDPASARFGEPLYAFWFRSVSTGYINAWRLEKKRLNRLGLSALNWKNQMIWFQLIQTAYLLSIGLFFGWAIMLFGIAAAGIGILLLESVNYIEHYGLRRKKLPSGRYEKATPRHSWNSNHELGRIFLYELTRHSDHHFKASRKYPVLRHLEESPQLPIGYPGSVLLSLAPPLWFRVMNKRVQGVSENS